MIVNLHNFDDTTSNDDSNNIVCIRKTLRIGRKHFTTIEGLNDRVNIKYLCKTLKKLYKCAGNTTKNNIHLQGDHVDVVKKIFNQK